MGAPIKSSAFGFDIIANETINTGQRYSDRTENCSSHHLNWWLPASSSYCQARAAAAQRGVERVGSKDTSQAPCGSGNITIVTQKYKPYDNLMT